MIAETLLAVITAASFELAEMHHVANTLIGLSMLVGIPSHARPVIRLARKADSPDQHIKIRCKRHVWRASLPLYQSSSIAAGRISRTDGRESSKEIRCTTAFPVDMGSLGDPISTGNAVDSRVGACSCRRTTVRPGEPDATSPGHALAASRAQILCHVPHFACFLVQQLFSENAHD